ncbi:MAG: TRAP transporter small permease [Burkholderiaceae bacterium]
MFRSLLNGLYGLCGVLACISLLAIAVIIGAQIIGRLFGVLVPSADDFAGYAMAASTFLGLAYTFRANGHIRVTLFTQRLSASKRRPAEIVVLILGIAIMGYFTWYNIGMAYTSYDFEELSQGLVPIPLWIPQAVLAFGTLLMAISMVDELIAVLSGRETTYSQVHDDVMQAE